MDFAELRAILLMVLFSILYSCNNRSSLASENVHSYSNDDFVTIIPLEQAMASLEDFLQETDLFETNFTKAFLNRINYSVQIKYAKGAVPLTKAINDSLPSFYVVNLIDTLGVAVLGANSAVDPVVAVAENCNILCDSLSVILRSFHDVYDAVDSTELSPYFHEIDSIQYIDSGPKIVSQLLTTAEHFDYFAQNDKDNVLNDPQMNGYGGPYDPPRRDIPPLLRTNWSQGKWHEYTLYNKYCLSSGLPVYAGCTTTAVAMIVAYNEYPSSIIYDSNERALDYPGIKVANPTFLSLEKQEDISILYGYLFQSMPHLFALSSGTCIFPNQALMQFKRMGYNNVQMYSSDSLNNTVHGQTIYCSLAAGKPVFISAAHGLEGHSWVIDGGKYYQGRYMLHCNWGWNGDSNGYFSLSCFNPSEGAEYDSTHSTDGTQYNWHFRLITYDI